GAEGGVVAEVEDRESAQVGDHVGSIHKRPAPTRARPAPLSPDGVPGRLSPVAGSLALGVARFLAACWLGGWRRRVMRGRRRPAVSPSAIRGGERRPAPGLLPSASDLPLMTRRRTGGRWGRQGASAAQPRQARATVPEGGVP